MRDESAAILDDGDLEGLVLGAVSGWADAEAELKAVARLRKFEDQYRLLAANSTNVVWELDREAVLRWVSPSLESVLGWTATELIDTTPLDLVHQIDQNALKEGFADALSGRETPQFESRIRPPKAVTAGSPSKYSQRCTPMTRSGASWWGCAMFMRK